MCMGGGEGGLGTRGAVSGGSRELELEFVGTGTGTGTGTGGSRGVTGSSLIWLDEEAHGSPW